MRRTARITLALVVVIALGVALPRPFTGRAEAQIPIPTPSVPVPDPSPDPSPSPVPTPTPSLPGDDDDGGGSGDGSDEGSGGGADDGVGAGDPTGGGRGADDDVRDGDAGDYGRLGRPTDDYLRVPGAYSTDRLVSLAARLSALGWPRERIVARVYRPFIIGGPANWVDSWGAPRFGPGPTTVRTHEGQDVFCRYGDPVLAVEAGRVSYGDGGLGGIVARLHRRDGSYWYYAHLSDTNDNDFPSGSRVGAGDVIGYCGNSGNAISTPPHVHFGWYQGNGSARNPMRALVRWLRTAERRAGLVAVRAHGDRLARLDSLIAARRFGDAFAPDLSELSMAGESLWSAGTHPAAGTFALAEAALTAALADGSLGDAAADIAPPDAVGAGDLERTDVAGE